MGTVEAEYEKDCRNILKNTPLDFIHRKMELTLNFDLYTLAKIM